MVRFGILHATFGWCRTPQPHHFHFYSDAPAKLYTPSEVAFFIQLDSHSPFDSAGVAAIPPVRDTVEVIDFGMKYSQQDRQ